MCQLNTRPASLRQRRINYYNTDRCVTSPVGQTEKGNRPYFASVRWHDEEGLDVVFLEEGVSLVAAARLHLVVSVQTLQGGPGDVHLPEGGGRRALNVLIHQTLLFYDTNTQVKLLRRGSRQFVSLMTSKES